VLFGGRRGEAVVECDDLVAVLIAGAHRRLDAAVGEETAQDDGRDALATQDEVEVRAGNGVQAALALDHDVTVDRRELVDDRRSPRPLDERLPVDDALQDAVGVRRDLVVALGEGDRCMHHGDTGRASSVRDLARVREHSGVVHDLRHAAVEGATLRGEVVLILDQHDGGGLRVPMIRWSSLIQSG
jgi:hypothetical protein